MKTCAVCGKQKPRSEFSKKSANPDGLQRNCKECQAEYHRKWRAENVESRKTREKRWRDENYDRYRTNQAKWLAENAERLPGYQRKYKEKVKSRIRARDKAYRIATREQAAEYRKKYCASHKPQLALKAGKRRAAKVKSTPKWANLDAVRAFYTLASATPGTHVDHIVPLVSKLVCGLHCEANLQLLPGPENQRKGNRVWPDMP